MNIKTTFEEEILKLKAESATRVDYLQASVLECLQEGFIKSESKTLCLDQSSGGYDLSISHKGGSASIRWIITDRRFDINVDIVFPDGEGKLKNHTTLEHSEFEAISTGAIEAFSGLCSHGIYLG